MARPKYYKTERRATAIRVDPTLHDWFHSESRRRDVSVNWLINRAMEDYQKRMSSDEPTQLMSTLGMKWRCIAYWPHVTDHCGGDEEDRHGDCGWVFPEETP